MTSVKGEEGEENKVSCKRIRGTIINSVRCGLFSGDIEPEAGGQEASVIIRRKSL